MTVVTYTLYDPASGRVLGHGSVPAALVPAQARPGLAVLPGVALDPAATYVDADGQPQPRTAFAGFGRTSIAADGTDAAAMDLPDPCPVRIDGIEHTVTGGRLVLTAAVPGAYAVTIDHPRHRPYAATITAT